MSSSNNTQISIRKEEECIGDLYNKFRASTKHRQLNKRISAGSAMSCIGKAWYRGRMVGREESAAEIKAFHEMKYPQEIDKLQAENDTLLLEVTGLNKQKDEIKRQINYAEDLSALNKNQAISLRNQTAEIERLKEENNNLQTLVKGITRDCMECQYFKKVMGVNNGNT